MADRFTTEQRSRLMSRVKSRDTKPEKIVRSLLHSMGYRFRLHRRDLPGKPDIVLPKHKAAIFVHGCFWHSHNGCLRAARPTANSEFWNKKLDGNIRRDRTAQQQLKRLGWRHTVIWQCQLKNLDAIKTKLSRFITKGAITGGSTRQN